MRIKKNIRIGSEFQSLYEDTIFVNCDMKKSLFVACTFKNCMFVNCDMDAVRFKKSKLNCIIKKPSARFIEMEECTGEVLTDNVGIVYSRWGNTNIRSIQ